MIEIKHSTTREVLKIVDAEDLIRANLEGVNLRDANLRDANLRGANLRGANLYYANLEGANLGGANLRDANLRDANLRGANLRGANLRGANLRGANLGGANLGGTDMGNADLRNADLRDADLRDAYLRSANLKGANLKGANLGGANLGGAELRGALLPTFHITPSEGSFIAWKSAHDEKGRKVVLKVKIGKNTARTNAIGSRKCRASRVTVLEGEGYSPTSNQRLHYQPGLVVRADSFDPDIRKECTHGIHFFMTREEAEQY